MATRLLVLLIGLACVAGTAKSIAYYTAAGQPRPSTDIGARDAAKSRVAQGRKPATRLADVTDNWLQSLLDPGFWRGGRSEQGRARGETRPKEGSHRRREERERSGVRKERVRTQSVRLDDGSTYRTMCVRLCDGYFWPVSFTATKREFARDSEICERSCESPAALHVYKNPGEEPEAMVDLKGQPYAKLGNAFRYRVGYDASCKCRPHPWEAASRQRHLSYAGSDRAHAQSASHGAPAKMRR